MRGAAAFAALLHVAAGYDNGAPHSRMPALGWSSWVSLGPGWPGPSAQHPAFDFCDEASVRASIDAFVDVGLYAAGYRHFHLDDCWADAGGRNASGYLVPQINHFPNGLAPLIDYAHQKGLVFGLYTCGGTYTCVGKRPGSEGHWDKDAAVWAEWGVDWVKMDWCNHSDMKPAETYPLMSAALNKTGRHIHFNMCEWGNDSPWEWGPAIAQSWRATGDHTPIWTSTRDIIAQRTKIPAALGGVPYAWNDMDMLETGNYAQAAHANGKEGTMTAAEYKTEFSMWAILASPLTVTTPLLNCSTGTCVASITALQKEILLNTDVIAINQDVTPAGRLVDGAAAVAALAAPNGTSCALKEQISQAKCVKGDSFGCFAANHSMYITKGCRGVFECDGVDVVSCDINGCMDTVCVCPCVAPKPAAAMVYARNLTGGDVAVALYNPTDVAGFGSVDFAKLGLPAGATAGVRDLWAHTGLGDFKGRYPQSGTVPVDAHATIVLRLSPK